MKLFFRGHQEKYAVEQSLLTLFPQERPTYPQEAPGGDGELELTFFPGRRVYTATALLRIAGKTYSRLARVRLPEGALTEVEETRLRRRVLQKAFYLAACEAKGSEPPWGMLSGVRPVKIPTKAILEGAGFSQARRLLRRTYRVSAPRCDLAMDCAAACLQVKKRLGPKEISLYVGIPFCPSRCSYCSFISAAGNANKLRAPYVEALLLEIAAAGAAVRNAGLTVTSLYLGGGTPTTLSAQELERILSALHEAFSLAPGLELTVEAGRPDTITAEKLAVLRAGGTTRVSLNPQTMEDAVLRAIGRGHTARDILETYPLLRQAGFEAVNMDLIAGLPGDSLPGFRRTLDTVLSLAPENITVHTLAQKKGARLSEDPVPLPAEGEVAAMLDFAWASLRRAGYRPYYLYRQKYISGGLENVGWCKPGFESTYNIVMMEELQSILSLGAGGVTKIMGPGGGSLCRHANPKYPQEYLREASRICGEKSLLFSAAASQDPPET